MQKAKRQKKGSSSAAANAVDGTEVHDAIFYRCYWQTLESSPFLLSAIMPYVKTQIP